MERYGKSFKEMNFKEKVAYLWEYYRNIALVSIIILILIVGLIVGARSSSKDRSLDITLAGKLDIQNIQVADLTKLEEDLDVAFEFHPVDWRQEDSLALSVRQRMTLQMKVSKLDILGLPDYKFEDYLKANASAMYMQLDELPEFQEILQEYKDQLVIKGYNVDENNNIIEDEEHVYGIRISKIDNIPGITLDEDLVLGVTTSVKDTHKAAEMMRFLLESK